MNQWQNFIKGVIKENPTFVLLLGMCPPVGVTTSAINGVGMGLATTFVLFMANLVISSIRRFVPDKIRIPIFIVIIAAFVIVVELLMKAYTPSLYDALGIFIPLIVANCLLLGRAEAFAYKYNVVSSAIDGLGMGVGFTIALTILGSIRELLGSGTFFGMEVFLPSYGTIAFVLAPGAFIVLGYLIVIMRKLISKFK